MRGDFHSQGVGGIDGGFDFVVAHELLFGIVSRAEDAAAGHDFNQIGAALVAMPISSPPAAIRSPISPSWERVQFVMKGGMVYKRNGKHVPQ